MYQLQENRGVVRLSWKQIYIICIVPNRCVVIAGELRELLECVTNVLHILQREDGKHLASLIVTIEFCIWWCVFPFVMNDHILKLTVTLNSGMLQRGGT